MSSYGTKETYDLYECQNCGKRISTRKSRITGNVSHPGEPVPVGECPECGALCHHVE